MKGWIEKQICLLCSLENMNNNCSKKISYTENLTVNKTGDNGITHEPSSLKIEKSDWMNSEQAAGYLQISTSQLLNLTSNGRIPHYKFGRLNRYRQRELNDLLLKNKRGVLYGN